MRCELPALQQGRSIPRVHDAPDTGEPREVIYKVGIMIYLLTAILFLGGLAVDRLEFSQMG